MSRVRLRNFVEADAVKVADIVNKIRDISDQSNEQFDQYSRAILDLHRLARNEFTHLVHEGSRVILMASGLCQSDDSVPDLVRNVVLSGAITYIGANYHIGNPVLYNIVQPNTAVRSI